MMFVAAPLVYSCNAAILHIMMFLDMGRIMLVLRMLVMLLLLRVIRIQLLKGMLVKQRLMNSRGLQ